MEFPSMKDDPLTMGSSTSSSAEIENLRNGLVASIEELVQSQTRLQGLLSAVISISQELSLTAVLQHVVQSACKLMDAKYGALGVIGKGKKLSHFITEGIDPELAERIGPLPTGHGVLGVLIDDPQPIRLDDLHSHPASVGFPPFHPPMQSFLGVPIRVHNVVFGNLYLTEKRHGKSFTSDDEDLAVVLATAAGLTIENANLFDEARLRTQWIEASMQVAVQMMDKRTEDAESGKTIVARQALEASSSVLALVGICAGEDGIIHVSAGAGALAPGFLRRSFRIGEGLVKRVFDEQQPVPFNLSEHLQGTVEKAEIGPALLIALGSSEAGRDLLILARGPGVPAYTDSEITLSGKYGSQSALALELMRAYKLREQFALFTDRDRIAKDLHDVVIQRLFAAGLSTKSLARFLVDPVALERIEAITNELDSTITELRETIYSLQVPSRTAQFLSTRIIQVVRKLSMSLPFAPSLHVGSAVDELVPFVMEGHVLAVVSEGMSNAVRHAKAENISIRVDVVDGTVVVVVVDDGCGFSKLKSQNGFDNMKARAQDLNGTFFVKSSKENGTHFEWTAPLAAGLESATAG
ncbi:GAF domain-containing protein [Paeniglutamicibacter sp. NPDC091659]|uniref:GAF domain-containing sensor histidine kinase n=1 Tax=Paeniglutamicibacter sp. NPDC091659 TaxID=3364389 RepID=UPI0038180A88